MAITAAARILSGNRTYGSGSTLRLGMKVIRKQGETDKLPVPALTFPRRTRSTFISPIAPAAAKQNQLLITSDGNAGVYFGNRIAWVACSKS